MIDSNTNLSSGNKLHRGTNNNYEGKKSKFESVYILFLYTAVHKHKHTHTLLFPTRASWNFSSSVPRGGEIEMHIAAGGGLVWGEKTSRSPRREMTFVMECG